LALEVGYTLWKIFAVSPKTFTFQISLPFIERLFMGFLYHDKKLTPGPGL